MVQRKKLPQLQGLRAVACLGVFLCHTLWGADGLGPWGVELFFLISGYCLTLGYLPEDRALESPCRFAWGKLKKIYPLHLITMAAMVALEIFVQFYMPEDASTLPHIALSAVLHGLLVHAWVPQKAVLGSLNGVDWYLSALAVAYLCFPAICRLLRREKRISRLLLLMAAAVCGSAAFSAAALVVSFWGVSAQWMTYYLPISRLPDFFVGCCLGALHVQIPEDKAVRGRAFCWLAAGLLNLAALAVYTVRLGPLGSDCIRFALLMLPGCAALLWLTAGGCRMLSWRPLVRLGDISGFFFLIHPPLKRWWATLTFYSDPPVWLSIAVVLVLALVLSLGWEAWQHRSAR